MVVDQFIWGLAGPTWKVGDEVRRILAAEFIGDISAIFVSVEKPAMRSHHAWYAKGSIEQALRIEGISQELKDVSPHHVKNNDRQTIARRLMEYRHNKTGMQDVDKWSHHMVDAMAALLR